MAPRAALTASVLCCQSRIQAAESLSTPRQSPATHTPGEGFLGERPGAGTAAGQGQAVFAPPLESLLHSSNFSLLQRTKTPLSLSSKTPVSPAVYAVSASAPDEASALGGGRLSFQELSSKRQPDAASQPPAVPLSPPHLPSAQAFLVADQEVLRRLHFQQTGFSDPVVYIHPSGPCEAPFAALGRVEAQTSVSENRGFPGTLERPFSLHGEGQRRPPSVFEECASSKRYFKPEEPEGHAPFYQREQQ